MHQCSSAPSSTMSILLSPRSIERQPTTGTVRRGVKSRVQLLRIASILLCCVSTGSLFAGLSYAKPAQWSPTSVGDRNPVQAPHSGHEHAKLIVLSTGAQLKLYPLSERDEVSAHQYYVLKPRAATGRDPFKRAEDQAGRDHFQVALSKPFITNLDSFVDPRFCPKANSCDTCLVVVWFDQSDQSIHYGSVDVGTMRPQSGRQIQDASSGAGKIDQPTLARQVDRVLYLDEHVSPINLCKTCNLLSMVVDKVRLRVYIAVNDTQACELGHSHYIASVQLHTLKNTAGVHERELILERGSDSKPAINSLIMDELSGSSLYYLDDTTKARKLQMDPPSGRHRNVLGRQIELNSIANVKMDEGVIPPAKIAGLTWSTTHQRFYWLTESTNQIYSSDVTGDNVVRVGEINSKPFIRSVDRLHLLGDTLFLSDSIKKSIISYGLKNQGDNNHTDSHASRHRVVLVEMPTVVDFKPIDLGEVYHINSLSCFDDDKAQFCTTSIRLVDGTKWQQQKYASSSNFTCDALAADWKQSVLSRQLDITQSEQSITLQQGPINEVIDSDPTFDLKSNRPQDDEKYLFSWQSIGARHQIPMQYICYGSIVAVVVSVVLLLIVYVTKYCFLSAKPLKQPNKRYTIRPYLLQPKPKIDKRPLVAIIDCETSSTSP